jgi:CheY-like chemotaxis protein
VLIVDDNPDALQMTIAALKDAGVDAVGAATASDALAMTARVRPDVAVLDIGLPDMDGFELARALRGLGDAAPSRLVALTGYGRDRDMEAARAAGFDAFLLKPVDISTLLGTIGPPTRVV